MHRDALRLIDELGLRPHPEGGYFAETYRSDIRVTVEARNRSAVTSIHFLLTGDTFSAFHRLASDEVWHHYEGAHVAIDLVDLDRGHRQLVIGAGTRRQAAIPAGVWFAAHVTDPDGYAFVGCDVAPGFEYEGFEVGSRAELLNAFPELAPLIERWTRTD
jgi:uncharacterized protein